MKAFFCTAFDYSYQMNHRLLHEVEHNPQAEAVRLLSHIIHAQQKWIHRLRSEDDSSIPLWEDMDKFQFEESLTRNHSEFVNYVKALQEGDFQKKITYKNTQGVEFTDRIEDILFHVINHATHHRAQISTLLRQSGSTPPVTDYIFYIRDRREV